MSSCILVVDDDVALAEMIGIVLENEGYRVVFCSDGSQALSQFQEHNPDLVLLDVMLPGMDGFDVCRAIRRVSDAPIVMLTARSDTADVVTGLEAGADDYVPKPFKPKELVARVRARLRGREDSQVDEGLTLQDLTIDVAGHIVKRDGRMIALTPGNAGALPVEGLLPRGTPRAGVGIPARRRHQTGERSRPASAFQDRTRS